MTPPRCCAAGWSGDEPCPNRPATRRCPNWRTSVVITRRLRAAPAVIMIIPLSGAGRVTGLCAGGRFSSPPDSDQAGGLRPGRILSYLGFGGFDGTRGALDRKAAQHAHAEHRDGHDHRWAHGIHKAVGEYGVGDLLNPVSEGRGRAR